ncbi:MAG: helix-turn-helix domain-containing protein [Candidatus Eisenbacteria bacterium]|nr:helix-turn-helix domain-containing protein [Candidatus Eisenbacteria bacterium]
MSQATERQFITEGEVSKITGIARVTLANWRHRRQGPAWTKAGAKVLYPLADLLDWLNMNRVDPAAREGAA